MLVQVSEFSSLTLTILEVTCGSITMVLKLLISITWQKETCNYNAEILQICIVNFWEHKSIIALNHAPLFFPGDCQFIFHPSTESLSVITKTSSLKLCPQNSVPAIYLVYTYYFYCTHIYSLYQSMQQNSSMHSFVKRLSLIKTTISWPFLSPTSLTFDGWCLVWP